MLNPESVKNLYAELSPYRYRHRERLLIGANLVCGIIERMWELEEKNGCAAAYDRGIRDGHEAGVGEGYQIGKEVGYDGGYDDARRELG